MLPPAKRQKTNQNVAAGPQRMKTPLRDEMKINQEDMQMDSAWEKSSLAGASQAGGENRSEYGPNYEMSEEEQIKSIFMNLPQPKHDYTLQEEQVA